MKFSVTDKYNHAIATLQPSDLAIVDSDLVVRDFRSFARTEYTRLDVAILVDASESITPHFRQELAGIVQFLNGTQGVPEESFFVATFRDLKPAILCAGNCRTLRVGGEFPAIQTGGLTPLYDAIVFASRTLGRDSDPHVRRVLVVFSDGADTISMTTLDEAMASALDNDVAIYSIDVGRPPHKSSPSLVLRSLSFKSGGRYLPVEAGSANLTDAILEDFHAAYTVAYKLPNHADGFHPVRILPTHDMSLQFHCPLGYYYPSHQEN